MAEQKRELTLEECKIDWNNYREVDIHGHKITKQSREEMEQQRNAICSYSESSLITRDKCFDYMYFDYYYDLLEEFCRQHKMDDRDIERLGLVKMFNDGWVTSPVFVNWRRPDVGFLLDICGYWVES